MQASTCAIETAFFYLFLSGWRLKAIRLTLKLSDVNGMIEIRNATVIRQGKQLFQNISWQLNAAEHWVIGGANGSGKTILLELLAGTVHPARGKVDYSFITG